MIELFNIDEKRSVKKYCRDLVVSSKDLFHIILAGRGGVLEPYRYACHFSDVVPPHLPLQERDTQALASNGVGPLKKEAAKATKKIFQLFVERRMFAAHVFFTPSQRHWHLFYFDQRDTDTRENHWVVGGSHIHYSRESFTTKPLLAVWEQLCQQPPLLPGSIHIRYEQLNNAEG